MIKRINHFAVVGRSNEEMESLFKNLFGFEVTEKLDVPEQGFKSTMVMGCEDGGKDTRRN